MQQIYSSARAGKIALPFVGNSIVPRSVESKLHREINDLARFVDDVTGQSVQSSEFGVKGV